MADQILFDKLIYIDRLKRAGVTEEQARAHAEAMDEALRESVATKLDIAAIKADLAELKYALTMRGIAGLIAAGGILFAALHYWPPHGL